MLKRQASSGCGSSKRQQPHHPQVSAITRHQRPDLLGRPLSTFLPLVRIEGIGLSGALPHATTTKAEVGRPPYGSAFVQVATRLCRGRRRDRQADLSREALHGLGRHVTHIFVTWRTWQPCRTTTWPCGSRSCAKNSCAVRESRTSVGGVGLGSWHGLGRATARQSAGWLPTGPGTMRAQLRDG
jgi:hypothetical protein